MDRFLGKVGALLIEGQTLYVRPVEFNHSSHNEGSIECEIVGLNAYRDHLVNRACEYLKDYHASKPPKIEKVIFNDPATVVVWSDGTKTVVKCQEGDEYSKETGLAMAIAKKYLGNNGNYNEIFKKWIPEDKPEELSVLEMRQKLDRYCNNFLICDSCPLHDEEVCRCGCGSHFLLKKQGESYDMTDDEIRAAYKIAFPEKR